MVRRRPDGPGPIPLYAPPPPRTRKSTILVSVLGLVLLVVVLIAFNPFGGDSTPSAGGQPSGTGTPVSPVATGSGPLTGSASGAQTPAAAVVQFIAAAKAKDLGAVKAVTCAAQFERVTSVPNVPAGMTIQLGTTEETGPTATVDLTETYKGETDAETVKLIRENGNWKICGAAKK